MRLRPGTYVHVTAISDLPIRPNWVRPSVRLSTVEVVTDRSMVSVESAKEPIHSPHSGQIEWATLNGKTDRRTDIDVKFFCRLWQESSYVLHASNREIALEYWARNYYLLQVW